ncbi:hypothetical protein FKP32DRAFT_748040 [Trametes sanguinea]|nr:hypothetical protein FKP32DRAFT_748040 [Trametes sanguinea]
MVLILRGLVPLLTLLCFLCSALSCIIIDNVDPQIQYQGTWVFETIYGGSPDYNGTLAHTNETQASVTFHFTGSSVAVYGAIKPVGTWDILSAYCLDDVPMGVYKPDPSVQAERDRVLFYASGPLGPGNHTLVVENMGEQFWLDYIGVGGPDDNPANPCPGPSLDPPTPSGSSSSSITGLSSSDTHQSSWSGITSSSKTVNPASSTQPSNTSNSCTFPQLLLRRPSLPRRPVQLPTAQPSQVLSGVFRQWYIREPSQVSLSPAS